MAQLRRLLIDGAGPLYACGQPGTLATAVVAVIEGIRDHREA
jgi:hypothetical protein